MNLLAYELEAADPIARHNAVEALRRRQPPLMEQKMQPGKTNLKPIRLKLAQANRKMEPRKIQRTVAKMAKPTRVEK